MAGFGFGFGSYKNNATPASPPLVQSASVNGTSMVITFDDPLDSASLPAAGNFVVTVAGSPRAVTGVAINATNLTLTLASAAIFGQAVAVTYTPGSTPLRNTNRENAAAFSGRAVTNNTVASPSATPLTVYGSGIISGTPLSSVAPLARKGAFIGDSRMAGLRAGKLSVEIINAIGEHVWFDLNSCNYAVGGTTIAHAATTQAPAAVSANCGSFFVLTGTNGSGDASGDSLATRQSQTIALLAGLDRPGAVIFLANEMPGSSGGGTAGPTKYGHHAWINGLTKSSASLVNADLVIVNTWTAAGDGLENSSAELFADWRNDGLHPANRGAERIAYAFYQAAMAYYTRPMFNVASPSQQLFDGSSLTTTKRGQVPNGWTDLTAADGLTYSTTGWGDSTRLSISNTTASSLSCNLRRTPSAVINGILMIEFEMPYNPSPSASGATSRNTSANLGVRNFDSGAGLVAISNFMVKDKSQTGQEQELGGIRRMAVYVGATSTSPRFDILFDVRPGGTIIIRRVHLYERS